VLQTFKQLVLVSQAGFEPALCLHPMQVPYLARRLGECMVADTSLNSRIYRVWTRSCTMVFWWRTRVSNPTERLPCHGSDHPMQSRSPSIINYFNIYTFAVIAIAAAIPTNCYCTFGSGKTIKGPSVAFITSVGTSIA